MDITLITEAYRSVYQPPQLDEEYEFYLEEIISEDSDIESLVMEMISEGYDGDDIEEIFNEILDEVRKMSPREKEMRAARRRSEAEASEKSAKEASKRAQKKEREEKRAERIAQVKGAVKGAITKAKEMAGAAKSAADKKVKDVKQKSHVGLAKYASDRKLMPGAGLKTQSSAGRSEVRKAVAKDIAGRVKGKISRGLSKAKTLAGGAASAAAGGAAEAGRSAKRAVKKTVGGAARKVATKAAGLASRLGEDVDAFDLVVGYLVSEGYVDDYESALKIMPNISEQWLENIYDNLESDDVLEQVLEAYKEFPTKKVMDKAGKLMGSSAGKTDPKSRKKTKRGIKMMDTMMQHSPD